MSGNKLALIVQFSSAGLDKLNGGLKNIVGLSKSGASALRALQQDSGRLKRELAATGKELRGASGNVTHLIDRQRALADQIEDTNRQIDRQKRLLAIAARADRIAARGRELRSRGRDNVIEGAAMAAPFLLAAREAGNFSSGLVDLQQKAELTDRQADQLGRTILRAAAAARQLPEATREGVDILAGFGLDPRRAAAMITPIGRLATAMKVDMADGAAAAFANLQNLKVAADDTGRALDIMAAAGNAGAFEVRDMARHFPGLTAQLNALGESGLGAVANLSAALQIARRTTGTSDEAANNLQNLFAKINSPSTVKAFQKNFGVDLPAAMAKLRAEGYDTLEAIALITQKATGGDLKKLGYAFEDMQAQGAIRALIQNLDDYRQIRDQTLKSEGTVDRAFNQRVARDATVQWRAFMGTASQVAIMVGSALLPGLNEVAGSVQGVMTHVLAWTQANPQLAAGIVKIAAGLVGLKIGFGIVQFGVGAILGPLSTAYRLFKQFRAVDEAGRRLTFLGRVAARAGPMVASAFGVIRTASLFLARGLLRAGAMMLANPMILAITLLVVAIGGAAYLIYRNWDRIKGAFWNGVAAIGRAVALARGYVASFVNVGRSIVDGIAAGIRAAPGKIWAALKSVVAGAWKGAKAYLGINSPSRLFMQMGGFVSDGLAIGIDRGQRRPVDSARRLAQGVAGGFSLPRSPFAAGSPSAAALAASGGGGGRPASLTIGSVTINLKQEPGENAEQFAKRVLAELRRLLAKEARGSYEDR
ncbi:phage tail tape measure protein [Sphingopyxis sp. NFH-91]|uniref:phage tail tape measure protein n=1 Tax=Sphingopyxis sp. NFH-91 TaxID=2744457 RepID=UPI001F48BDE4|nr:phage tail tape measure protein [Sphingopyxis sp. NFH-91]